MQKSGWAAAQPPRVPAPPPPQQQQQQQLLRNAAPSAFSPGQTRYHNQFLHHERAAHRAAQAATSRQTSGSDIWRRGPRQQHAVGQDRAASEFFTSAQRPSSNHRGDVGPLASAECASVPPGFPVADASTTGSWIFPTSEEFAEREYQRRIIETALFHNTLVSLPTGLGKTFIAAVVMYNFYRWFPRGQVVFMAPTRPLVRQQIAACHSITGLPEQDTAELQGCTKPTERSLLWRSRRVVFCTPQSLHNDLKHGRAVAKSIVLLVVDEAHRATGKYAYCEVVRALDGQHQAAGWATPIGRYRVLALSATPGTDLERVQDVVTNLHISKLEVRTEIDPDVQPYTHGKTINKVTVPLSPQLDRMKKAFLDLMRPPVQRLFSLGVLPFRDPKRVNVMSLRHFQEQFRQQPTRGAMSHDEIIQVQSDLSLLMSLSSALRELTTHGTLAFHRSLLRLEQNGNTSRSKNLLLHDAGWRRLLRSLEDMDRKGQHLIHPKLVKLSQVLREHFSRRHAAGGSTRAIVFTQTRTSVDEIMRFLKDHPGETASAGRGQQQTLFSMGHAPKTGGANVELRPAVFVGQGAGARVAIRKANAADDAPENGVEDEGDEEDGVCVEDMEEEASTSHPWWSAAGQSKQAAASSKGNRAEATMEDEFAGSTVKGQTQKEQVDTIRRFRSGAVNVLVATCIGEEGLDIGDVGLIVMFDAVGSPIRTIQRLGRTGRSRSGECVALVTPGTESNRFDKAFQSYRRIALSMRNNASRFQLLTSGPRLLSRVPYPPPMERKSLVVGQFRLSQVGGLESRSRSGAAGRGTSRDIRDWGVTRSQEKFVTTRCQVEVGEAPVRLGNDRGLAQIMRLDRMDPRHIALQEALDPTYVTDANHSSRTRILSFLLRHMHDETVSQRSVSLSASIASEDASPREAARSARSTRQPLGRFDSWTARGGAELWETVTDPGKIGWTARMFDEMVRIGQHVDEQLRERSATNQARGQGEADDGQEFPVLRESQGETRATRVAELVEDLDDFSEEDDDFEDSDERRHPRRPAEGTGSVREETAADGGAMQDEDDEDNVGMADPLELWGSQREAVAGGVLCGGDSPTRQDAQTPQETSDAPLAPEEVDAMFADAMAILGPVPRLESSRGASPIRLLDDDRLRIDKPQVPFQRNPASLEGAAWSNSHGPSLYGPRAAESIGVSRVPSSPPSASLPREETVRAETPHGEDGALRLHDCPIPSPERMPPPSRSLSSSRRSSGQRFDGPTASCGGTHPQRTPAGTSVARPTPPSSADSEPVVRPTRRRLLHGKRSRSSEMESCPQGHNNHGGCVGGSARERASPPPNASQEGSAFESSESQEEPVQPAAKRRRRCHEDVASRNHARKAIHRRFFELDAEEEEGGEERGGRIAGEQEGDGEESDDDNYDLHDGFLDDRPLSQLTSQSSQGGNDASVAPSPHDTPRTKQAGRGGMSEEAKKQTMEKKKKKKKKKSNSRDSRGVTDIEYRMQQEDAAFRARFGKQKGLLQELMRQMETGSGALVDQARAVGCARRRRDDASDELSDGFSDGEDSFIVDDLSENYSVFASPPGSGEAFDMQSVSQAVAASHPRSEMRPKLAAESVAPGVSSLRQERVVSRADQSADEKRVSRDIGSRDERSGRGKGDDGNGGGGPEWELKTPAVIAASRRDLVFASSEKPSSTDVPLATSVSGAPGQSVGVHSNSQVRAVAQQTGSPPQKMTKEQAAIVARAQLLTRLVGLEPAIARSVAKATQSLPMAEFAEISPPVLWKRVDCADFSLRLAAKTRAHVMKWWRTREQALGSM